MFKNKTILTLILLAFVFKAFLSFSTIHADTIAFSFAGNVVKGGNILNFYDYLYNLPQDSPILSVYPINLFIYPPLPYFVFGLTSFLTSFLVDQNITNAIVYNLNSVLGDINLNWFLMLFKIPYFIFDLLIAYFISLFFKDERQRLYAFGLWLFNPISTYSTFMMGQFDIIPTFLSILSLYLASKNKFVLASFVLGLGASFKIFPALFILPLAFTQDTFIKKVKIALVGLGTYVLATFPYVFSIGYRNSAMLADHSTKSFFATIPVSGGQSIVLFLAFILFSYIVFYYSKNTLEKLWEKYFILLLIFFVFTHYHPQWFTWITPFIIIDLIRSKFKHGLVVVGVLISFFGLLSFFDAGLTTRIFAPLWPELKNLPDLWNLLGINFQLDSSRSLLHTVYVGLAMYYLYLYFPRKDESKL